jgi:hypothetical protein
LLRLTTLRAIVSPLGCPIESRFLEWPAPLSGGFMTRLTCYIATEEKQTQCLTHRKNTISEIIFRGGFAYLQALASVEGV